MDQKREHLPLFGVGPAIVFGQFAIALFAIALSWLFGPWLKVAEAPRIVLGVIGVCLIAFGLYLDISAKYRSKLFDNVAQNKLITTGVYAITRNPVYSAALLASTGAVLIWGDMACLIAAIIQQSRHTFNLSPS